MKLRPDTYSTMLAPTGADLHAGEHIVWIGRGGIGIRNLAFGTLCLIGIPILSIVFDIQTALIVGSVVMGCFTLWLFFGPVRPLLSPVTLTNRRILIFGNLPESTRATNQFDLQDLDSPRIRKSPVFKNVGDLFFQQVLPWKRSIWLTLLSFPYTNDQRDLRLCDVPNPDLVAMAICDNMTETQEFAP